MWGGEGGVGDGGNLPQTPLQPRVMRGVGGRGAGGGTAATREIPPRLTALFNFCPFTPSEEEEEEEEEYEEEERERERERKEMDERFAIMTDVTEWQARETKRFSNVSV